MMKEKGIKYMARFNEQSSINVIKSVTPLFNYSYLFTDMEKLYACHGACGVFALAMHQTIVEVKNRVIGLVRNLGNYKMQNEEPDEYPKEYISHLVVDVDGRFYDITGRTVISKDFAMFYISDYKKLEKYLKNNESGLVWDKEFFDRIKGIIKTGIPTKISSSLQKQMHKRVWTYYFWARSLDIDHAEDYEEALADLEIKEFIKRKMLTENYLAIK